MRTICATCKKLIRDEPEIVIPGFKGCDSHGMCEDCAEAWKRALDAKKGKGTPCKTDQQGR